MVAVYDGLVTELRDLIREAVEAAGDELRNPWGRAIRDAGDHPAAGPHESPTPSPPATDPVLRRVSVATTANATENELLGRTA